MNYLEIKSAIEKKKALQKQKRKDEINLIFSVVGFACMAYIAWAVCMIWG